jgi:predicted DNA-binding transcriptional regulator AlpA
MAGRAALLLPRILRAPSAAEYAGYSTAREFLRAVAAGEMPPGFQHGGGDAWDRHEIDDAIDLLMSCTKRGYSWQERGVDRV